MTRPELGAPYTFVPAHQVQPAERPTRREPGQVREDRKPVHGRIVYINEKHHYFTVRYTVDGVELRENFKF